MEEKRLALIQGFPRFIRKIAEDKIAIELFESYKAAPYVQKIREFIKLPFYYASFLSQLVWTPTFNRWEPLFTFMVSENCCFLDFSEVDQSLLKKQAAISPQSEEKPIDLLYSFHCVNKFYLEAYRLFHPQILLTGICDTEVRFFAEQIDELAST